MHSMRKIHGMRKLGGIGLIGNYYSWRISSTLLPQRYGHMKRVLALMGDRRLWTEHVEVDLSWNYKFTMFYGYEAYGPIQAYTVQL